jgi:pleiotropic regulator 1
MQSTPDEPSTPLIGREEHPKIKSERHAPWKLQWKTSGHVGRTLALAVDPGNHWFCSGGEDCTIKIWDLKSGSLKLTLSGQIPIVRSLAVSPRYPYIFSSGEDRMIECWDLETNKVIRQFEGHSLGVYAMAVHPTLDVLVTGGRDGTVHVWDIRTPRNVHLMKGHTNSISDVKCQEADPQVLSASLDNTIRLWDLASGKTMTVLAEHKREVRSLALHSTYGTFASGGADSIKQWKCPDGAFIQNFEGHNDIINTLSVNADGVLFSGGENGSMKFWDWKSAYNNQSMDIGRCSLDDEAGICCSTFDKTGSRLITGNADKTIHIYRQDDGAVCSSEE